MENNIKTNKLENRNIKFSNKNKERILLVVILIILDLVIFISSSFGANLENANIYGTHDCPSLIGYKNISVRVIYVEYKNEGVSYPAYCLDKTMPGVETGAYDVSINKQINDVGLWRVITNGYPYKTLSELGVQTKEEAFTATKQAIYCYIHGNDINSYYALSSAGEAGVRTINALHKILNDAKSSTKTKISSTIYINKSLSEWKQDSIEKEYMSKTFVATADAPIGKYEINLTRKNHQDIGGIKITDINNNEKTIFNPNEEFKVLVPIKNMTSIGSFELNVNAQVDTKPIFYGQAPNGLQDHALTTGMYEDGTGMVNDKYPENETKIIIIKQDEKTKERLENVEFELLDENNNVIYSNLKTDADGKIMVDNIVPGKYYLRETISIDGYSKYDELIEFNIEFNNQYTITVNNSKEKTPVVEIEKEDIELEVKSKEVIKEEAEEVEKEEIKQNKEEKIKKPVKKLPKTGM